MSSIKFQFLFIILAIFVEVNYSASYAIGKHWFRNHAAVRSIVGLPSWSYHNDTSDPRVWSKIFEQCDGDQQSPININTGQTEKLKELGPFRFVRYSQPLEEYFIKNNGHTAQVQSRRDTGMPVIHGAGLGRPYVLKQLHFHWGRENSRGSEHTVDGTRHPAEMHIVHENAEEMSEGKGGLAVLGVFFKLSKIDNPHLKPIVDAIPQVIMPGSEAELPGNLVLRNLLPKDTTNYFRYNGSLTTPPCTEGVIWTIFATPVDISLRQLRAFRLLKQSGGSSPQDFISDNYRPQQDLGRRKVLESIPRLNRPFPDTENEKRVVKEETYQRVKKFKFENL